MPLPAALVMFDDVLAALEQRHAAGAVHGEVSLAAIWIDDTGQCHLRTDDDPDAAYVAGRGGTHRYAAPEVRRGGNVTANADAYAATAVFVEALTGLPPDVGREVIASEASRPALADDPLPPAVGRVVEMGMAYDESRRPPNTGALRDGLATASTSAFPMVDWRARGRAWLAAATPGAAPGPGPQPATSTTNPSLGMPGPTLRSWAGGAAAATAGIASVGAGAAAALGAAAATSAAPAMPFPGAVGDPVPTPTPMPWQSQVPSFSPASTPSYGYDADRLPPLPGIFRRLGRGDPSVVAGCGISVIGAILVLIGAIVAMSVSGPNNASASRPTPALSGPDNSNNSAGSPTPPLVGTSAVPGPAGESAIASPSPTASAAPSAQASPSPTDNGQPSFTPFPTFSQPPTPAPTPTSCFLGLGC